MNTQNPYGWLVGGEYYEDRVQADRAYRNDASCSSTVTPINDETIAKILSEVTKLGESVTEAMALHGATALTDDCNAACAEIIRLCEAKEAT